jgi:hypothetical protein
MDVCSRTGTSSFVAEICQDVDYFSVGGNWGENIVRHISCIFSVLMFEP